MSSSLSRRAKLDRRAGVHTAYQPVGLRLVSEPGVYANASAVMIAVERIRPNPRNPRRAFSAEALDELAASIREKGILNPITVRRTDDPAAPYVVVAGDRRLRAALQVGLAEVPCIVTNLTEDEAFIASLVENLQREDLSPKEEASALLQLVVEQRLGVREVARLIHKDPAYVSRRVRVAQDPELLEAVEQGLAMTAAELLLGVEDRERRRALIARFQRGEIKTQHLARLLRPAPPAAAAPAAGADPSEPAAAGAPTAPAPSGATRQKSEPPGAGRAAGGQGGERAGGAAALPDGGRAPGRAGAPPAEPARGADPAETARAADPAEPEQVPDSAAPGVDPHGAPAGDPDPAAALARVLTAFAAASAASRASAAAWIAAGARPPAELRARLAAEFAAWRALLGATPTAGAGAEGAGVE